MDKMDKIKEIIKSAKKDLIKLVGEEKTRYLINSVPLQKLFECMIVCSNDSIYDSSKGGHRERDLNILDYFLQDTPRVLYESKTYGTCPNAHCTNLLAEYTKRRYGNFQIFTKLVIIKHKEIQKWLLSTYEFNEREKRLLHYFNRGFKDE